MVQDIGMELKKDSKKMKKDWKKVLTKGDGGGIIVKLSRETAITTQENEWTEKLLKNFLKGVDKRNWAWYNKKVVSDDNDQDLEN